MIALALLLQVGAATGSAIDSAVTVGDTIWLDRHVAIAPGQVVQPAAWTPDDPVEVLGPPDIVTGNGQAVLRYPLVIWRAGRHRLEVPGPLVIGRDGRVDSLVPQVVTVEVASVLPAVPTDSALPPQPRAGIVPRPVTSPWPLVVLLAMAVAVLLPLTWWSRRRGKVAAWPPPDDTPPPSVPLERWAEAGERRAVASAAAIRLRAAIAGRAAEANMHESRAVLAALDTARFGTDADVDVLALAERAARLEAALAVPTP